MKLPYTRLLGSLAVGLLALCPALTATNLQVESLEILQPWPAEGEFPADDACAALGVSGDGRVVVGTSGRASASSGGSDLTIGTGWGVGIWGRAGINFNGRYPLQRAVAWNGNVMTELYMGRRGEARDACHDGSVIVGATDANAFRWENGTLTRLTQFEEDTLISSMTMSGRSRANAVSADGTVVVGQASVNRFTADRPVMWKDGEPTFIESCDGGIRDVTADGATLLGYGRCGVSGPITDPGLEPWRDVVLNATPPSTGYLWQEGRIEELAERFSPNAISPDGFLIAGSLPDCTSPSNYPTLCILTGEHAALWRDGVLQLLPLPDGDGYGRATALSADGTLIAGHSSADNLPVIFGNAYRAVLWTEAGGFEPVILDDLLDASGIDRGGFQLEYANAISEDGLVIVGAGRYPGGKPRGYVLRLRDWDRYPFRNGVRHAGDWLGDQLLDKAGHAFERQAGRR